jgi:hypothetical protein
MHSASIDVQKILSDEVDDKAWNPLSEGNRGIFTRRAMRLLRTSRAIAAQYDSDHEFRTRSITMSDFEAMLRRVLAELAG